MKSIKVVVSIIFSLMLLAACGHGHNGTDNSGVVNGKPIFSLADLAGTWEFNGLESPGPKWERGPLTVDSFGSISGTLTAPDGSTSSPYSTFSITPDGIITTSYDASLGCVMDSGKTIIACTGTDDGGKTSRMVVLSKKAASYSLFDLTGTWEVNELDSPGPSWDRGPVSINSTGSFTGTITDWHGSPFQLSGTVSITSDGILRFVGPMTPSQRCVIDSGKTIIVCTQTNDDGGSGMLILSKKAANYSLADLAGTWELNSMESPGPKWERGPITFDSFGSISGTLISSDGSASSQSGALSITPDGILTAPGTSPSLRCAMNSGKTIITCTETDDAGKTTRMHIWAKKQ